MSTNDDFEFYNKFCEKTELNVAAKDLKRAWLVVLTRVIVILLLWFFFVRPYLDSRLFTLLVCLFVYIQAITVFYGRFAKQKTWFREEGPW